MLKFHVKFVFPNAGFCLFIPLNATDVAMYEHVNME